MLQLEIPRSAATETLCSQINLKKKRKEIIAVDLLPHKSGSWPVESLRCVHGTVFRAGKQTHPSGLCQGFHYSSGDR